MKNTKVSVIINNYNYAAYLASCINSAIHQTYPYVEVVVVDDGSSDNSQAIINSFSNKIQIVLKDNAGQASALNAGFSACTGDIICFLDADDLFQADKVSQIVQCFMQYPAIGWCFHTLAYIDTVGAPHSYLTQSLPSASWDLRTQIASAQPLPYIPTATSGMCFSRHLLEQILPMPDEIRITSDNYLKFAAIALSKGYFESTALAQQRLHESNAYTHREDQVELKASVSVSIAYALRTKFPTLEKFADGLFIRGLGIYLRTGISGPQAGLEIRRYFRGMRFFRSVNILLRVISCTLKNPENIKRRRVKYG
ncbi:glycosyltransferase family A protein [Acaryochloris sp. IP29b_bin.148]|uniref:glycosyltransferase family 2 protein n=1 Tax=Acaryochloris sp. IP29b_bin.148 TaxID=2969218 RepID=UPI002634B384|nr:glycosyltransferase family A protein [Acaryochloris sp. IP29b_bin.148]